MEEPSVSFAPNWASPPGETLMELLDEKGIDFNEFARMIDVLPKTAKKILNGQEEITTTIAKSLETVGGSSSFWLKRESDYRNSYNRIIEESQKDWIKNLPLTDMVKYGWIKRTKNMIDECLSYFAVDSLESYNNKYNREMQVTAFRTSKTFTPKSGAVAAWLRQGEIQANKAQCAPYNEELFEKTLVELKKLTRKKDPNEFIPIIKEACSKCGVSVVVVRTPKGCYASGATKFVGNKAILLLSLRYLSDDQFWFSFFHEAGHIMLHRNQEFYLEEKKDQSQLNEIEADANYFASGILIPHELEDELNTLKRNKRSIVKFAQKAGISPGIVVGQLQHRGIIKYNYLNSYKRRYKWEDLKIEYF